MENRNQLLQRFEAASGRAYRSCEIREPQVRALCVCWWRLWQDPHPKDIRVSSYISTELIDQLKKGGNWSVSVRSAFETSWTRRSDDSLDSEAAPDSLPVSWPCVFLIGSIQSLTAPVRGGFINDPSSNCRALLYGRSDVRSPSPPSFLLASSPNVTSVSSVVMVIVKYR